MRRSGSPVAFRMRIASIITALEPAEIAQKFDRIVEFSGVEDFVDTQVKRYSSGMNARLGFAIAAHMDPDVLIIDEALAVGDVFFFGNAVGGSGTGDTATIVIRLLGREVELHTPCSSAPTSASD